MQEKIALQELGLTEIESNVYLALVKLGSTKTGPLIKKTELHRATVYDVLKRLIEKGLVSYITKEKTKHFEATPPEYILDKIREEEIVLSNKSKLAHRLIRKLDKIKRESKNKTNANVYQGVRGIKSIFEEILRSHEYFVIGSKGKFGEILGTYYKSYQKRKKRLKIKSKILLAESLRGSDYVKTIHGEIKYLPKEFDSPTATFIFDNKVAIFVFVEQPVAFIIESKEVVKSYGDYFQILWKISKP